MWCSACPPSGVYCMYICMCTCGNRSVRMVLSYSISWFVLWIFHMSCSVFPPSVVISCPGTISRGVGQVPDVLVRIVQMSGLLWYSCTLACLLRIHLASRVFAKSVQCVVVARDSGSISPMKKGLPVKLHKYRRVWVRWCRYQGVVHLSKS